MIENLIKLINQFIFFHHQVHQPQLRRPSELQGRVRGDRPAAEELRRQQQGHWGGRAGFVELREQVLQ